VSYEAFVRAPEPQLQRLVDFLELPYEDAMLQEMNIRTDHCQRWKNKFYMSQKERALFELAAGDTLLALGYELSQSDPPRSLGLVGFSVLDNWFRRLSNYVLR
jgi:hypothetical protein